MDMPTQLIRAFSAMVFACMVSLTSAHAQNADVTRSQSALVTIQIGDLDEVHTVPLIAYQALLRQGVPTTLISGPTRPAIRQNNRHVLLSTPAPSAPQGADPLTVTSWTVGVFR